MSCRVRYLSSASKFLRAHTSYNALPVSFFTSTMVRSRSEETIANRVVMSGIQPTGIPHIGNFFGAIEHWRHIQNTQNNTEMIISIVDLHSITVHQEPNKLRESIRNMLAILLACGLDNKKITLFQQSAVSAHVNLSWVLACLTSVAKLEHLPQWKEKHAANNQSMESVPVGLLTYPVLQAADILIYRATHVPVGEDQVKHLELARHLAKAFNKRFGQLFPQPQTLTVEFKRICSLRNPAAKMSKSDKDSLSRIELLDSPDHIREKIRKAVSDFTPHVTYDPAERPGVSNLVDILCACTDLSVEEVCETSLHLDTAGFKSRVAEAVIERLRPIREEFLRLRSDKSYLDGVMNAGNERAAVKANATYEKVRQMVGFI